MKENVRGADEHTKDFSFDPTLFITRYLVTKFNSDLPYSFSLLQGMIHQAVTFSVSLSFSCFQTKLISISNLNKISRQEPK